VEEKRRKGGLRSDDMEREERRRERKELLTTTHYRSATCMFQQNLRVILPLYVCVLHSGPKEVCGGL